jgi:hypothetical protein
MQKRAAADELLSRSAQHAEAADARLEDVDRACGPSDVGLTLETVPIISAEPIVEADAAAKYRSGRGHYPERLKGARINIRAPAGTPRDSVVSALRCEAARDSAGLGASPDSPLTVGSATTTVEQRTVSVMVEVRSEEPRSADEILRRARRLASAK